MLLSPKYLKVTESDWEQEKSHVILHPTKQMHWVVYRLWLFACGVCPFCTHNVYDGLGQRARAQRTMFWDINIMKREEEIPQRRGWRDGAPSLHFVCAEFVA